MKDRRAKEMRISIIGIAAQTAVAFFTIVLAATHTSAISVLADDGAKLVGNWVGESICAPGFPACHDEEVIYRIPKPPDQTGKVTITADKIVDGKPETMGVLDFQYDREKSTLTCEFTRGNTHGIWEFAIKGNTMEGTLTVLPAKKVARNVKLKKEE